MRRRVLVSTLAALAVAVVLLGIPLMFLAAQIVRSDALSDLQARTDTAARALEVRYDGGENIDERVIRSYLGVNPGAPVFVGVRLPNGTDLEAGERPASSFSASRVTDSGVVVIMLVDRWDIYWEIIEVIVLVFVVGVLAVLAGTLMARWQANRLAAPLVYLAASAEQLGTGQVRLKVERSGVEEIDMVADELVRSADRMAARLATERQFAADASHQLRTPLTALSMRLEEITHMTEREDVRAEVDASLEQVERLVGVVDDLLGRSRRALGAGTEVVSLHEVLEQQREEWEAAFAKQGRTLRIAHTEDLVFATPGGLAQVLATLIENSLIHGGGVTQVAARETGSGHSVVIEVRDEGPGVPEELAPLIFERDVTSGKGTGIGLALARDLVTADGGRLELSQRVPAAFLVFLQGVPSMMDVDSVVPHSKALRTRKRKAEGVRKPGE